MKADRTVIVFGVFIFLIGLAVAWNGYGYIEVERGWSMVISGTIAFSAGLVLIGLGLILRQLKILSASAAQVALFLAKAGQNGAAAQPIAPYAPEEPAAEAEAVAGQAPVPPEAAPVEQAPAPFAEDFSAPPRPWMTRATTYAAAFGAAHVAEPDAAPAEPFLDENRDWLEKAVAEEVAAQEALFREARFHEAAPDEAKVPEAFAPEAFAHETPADEFPAEQEREEAVVEPPASNAGYGWEHAVEEPVEEQEPQEIGSEIGQEIGKAIGALAPEPAEPPAPHEPAPEPSAEVVHEEPAEPAPPSTPAILGQYEASGARYTMYVDGTIDAETPHGVYRFESMEELKRFLERSA